MSKTQYVNIYIYKRYIYIYTTCSTCSIAKNIYRYIYKQIQIYIYISATEHVENVKHVKHVKHVKNVKTK